MWANLGAARKRVPSAAGRSRDRYAALPAPTCACGLDGVSQRYVDAIEQVQRSALAGMDSVLNPAK